ncbi:MAG: tRNA (adenosine(37)-N6)-threonylcarbamoyltransferase complex dimerization subunit type 1 TsaB [Actinobacteria bacterium]|nr:tRNA (adenosine(37)-N6)-threonylcarbamoyltransferase complex dimerization subunit type 1 TsaB [Actinomycetota bacterium]
MIVLALETATGQLSVAVSDGQNLSASFQYSDRPMRSELLPSAVESVCAMAGVSLSDISAIAVDIGPGMFSGLRVGVTTAKTMARALGIKLVTMSSLELLAYQAVDYLCSWQSFLHADNVSANSSSIAEYVIVPIIDAKKGEVFCTAFSALTPLVPIIPFALYDATALVDVISSLGGSKLEEVQNRFIVIGDGAVRYWSILEPIEGLALLKLCGSSCPLTPASFLAQLGLQKLAFGDVTDPDDVEPLYLKLPQIRVGWEKRPHVVVDVDD